MALGPQRSGSRMGSQVTQKETPGSERSWTGAGLGGLESEGNYKLRCLHLDSPEAKPETRIGIPEAYLRGDHRRVGKQDREGKANDKGE